MRFSLILRANFPCPNLSSAEERHTAPFFFTALFSLSCKAIVDTQFKLFNQNSLHEAGCGNSHGNAEKARNAPRLRRGWRAIEPVRANWASSNNQTALVGSISAVLFTQR